MKRPPKAIEVSLRAKSLINGVHFAQPALNSVQQEPHTEFTTALRSHCTVADAQAQCLDTRQGQHCDTTVLISIHVRFAKRAAHTCRLDTGLRQAAAAAPAAFRPQRFLRLWSLAVAIPVVVLAIIVRSFLSFLHVVQDITHTADRFLLWICRTNEQKKTISSEKEWGFRSQLLP